MKSFEEYLKENRKRMLRREYKNYSKLYMNESRRFLYYSLNFEIKTYDTIINLLEKYGFNRDYESEGYANKLFNIMYYYYDDYKNEYNIDIDNLKYETHCFYLVLNTFLRILKEKNIEIYYKYFKEKLDKQKNTDQFTSMNKIINKDDLEYVVNYLEKVLFRQKLENKLPEKKDKNLKTNKI